jgi:hypothetical protein
MKISGEKKVMKTFACPFSERVVKVFPRRDEYDFSSLIMLKCVITFFDDG